MKNRADVHVVAGERGPRAALRESADADDDARPQLPHDVAQGLVAGGAQRVAAPAAGSLSGVRLRALDSMNASGQ